MDTPLLLTMLTLLSIVFAYMNYKTQVYLYYGRALASEEHLKVEKNGYQTAIMDPSTDKWFFVVGALFFINIIAIFYLLGFIFGVLSVVNYFVIMFIVRLVLPRENSPKWAMGIYRSIVRREADFKRDGDELRYEAIKHIRQEFETKFLLNQ